MKIINASYQFLKEDDINKKIERVARICYKSEEKIGEGTDIKMINSLVSRNHLAMLEHASLAFRVDAATYNLIIDAINTIEQLILKAADKESIRCYLRLTQCAIPVSENMSKSRFIISGNMRAWIETLRELEILACVPPVLYEALMNNASAIMKASQLDSDIVCGVAEGYQYEAFDGGFFAEVITDFTKLTPEERMVHEDMSVLFTVDRGITHELVRHRDCSFAQESTRYCNYNLGKFGQEITVIEPCFWDTTPENGTPESIACYNAWYDSCTFAETQYFNIIHNGGTPQQARAVLPSSTKADIVMTTNLREWKHIFNLRACDATGAAHPQVKEVMVPCFKELRDGDYNFAFENMLTMDEAIK